MGRRRQTQGIAAELESPGQDGQGGKAAGFGPVTRRFESFRPRFFLMKRKIESYCALHDTKVY